MKHFLFIILLSTILTYINTLVELGRCPEGVSRITSFNLNRFMGRWFTVASSNSDDAKTKCSTALYTRMDNGGFNIAQTAMKKNGDSINDVGKAEPTTYPGKFKITFHNSFYQDIFKEDYQVIDTDYINFAIIYSCTNYVTFRRQHVWIIKRNLDNYQNAIRDYTNYIDHKLNLKKFELKTIDNCRESCKFNSK